MVQLTYNEAALVDQLFDTIEEAMASLSDIDSTYANKTKLQKLLYLAIDKYDIPITFSWYLAGAVIPDQSIGPDSLVNSTIKPTTPGGPTVSSVGPDLPDQDNNTPDPAPVSPILFNGNTGGSNGDSPYDLKTYVARDELVEFYRQELPSVWHEQTMRFLQNFYQEMAPEDYRLLYIESTHLRTHLTELTNTVESHIQGDSPTQSIEVIRESIELSISDLHYYLRSNDILQQTFEVVVTGTDLIEDVLMMLEQYSPAEITEDHLTLLKEIQDFFYYYVWKYPCLLISEETASGPCASKLRSTQAKEFKTFDEQIRKRHAELEASLEAANLLPGPDDYPSFDNQETAETLTDLSSRYYE